MENNLKSRLNKLKICYLIDLKNKIEIFNNMIDNLNQLNIDELYGEVHKISGTGGIYGLKELSNASTNFEFYLKNIKNSNFQTNEVELKNKLIQYVKNIQKSIRGGI